MKKAQGLSINTIIIAAIALLVLVVLSYLFLTQVGPVPSQVNDCQNKGGRCFAGDIQCGQGDAAEFGLKMDWVCPDDQVCCLPVEK